jgi:hypothetical protein
MSKELNSVGYICQQTQRSYSDIAAAIAALGLQPAAILNGVPHFDAAAVDAVLKRLDEKSI